MPKGGRMKEKSTSRGLRDSLNRLPEDLREIYHFEKRKNGDTKICANPEKGWRMMTRLGSLFHRNTRGCQGAEARFNRKFVCPDDLGGSVEAVICFPPGKEPYLVTDPLNRGTYNFISPVRCDRPAVTPKTLWGHLRKDLFPYLQERVSERKRKK